MTGLMFLSPDRAERGQRFEPRLASPVRRALGGDPRIRDLSGLGKIEVRGDIDSIDTDAQVVRIAPGRALVLCVYERCAELRGALPGTVIDMTGALAGLELADEQTMRRLTDLDLGDLPAVALTTVSQEMLPRFVRTPVTRPLLRSTPVTSVYG